MWMCLLAGDSRCGLRLRPASLQLGRFNHTHLSPNSAEIEPHCCAAPAGYTAFIGLPATVAVRQVLNIKRICGGARAEAKILLDQWTDASGRGALLHPAVEGDLDQQLG